MRGLSLHSLGASVLAILAVPLSAQEPPNDLLPSTSEPSPYTFGTTVVIPGGLRGTLYLLPNDTTVLPDFSRDGLHGVGQVWTDSLNIPPRHFRSGFPGITDRFEWFAIDYDGRFWIDTPGRYTFALLSDDGSRLFIDDTPVIDNDCLHPPDLRVAATKLEGGVHRIRVSYFQGPRDCLSLVLAIAGPDHRWKIFSTNEFKPPSNPDDWRYPEANAVSLVPATPAEASLSKNALFAQLGDSVTREKRTKKSQMLNGCDATPTRYCGK